MGKLDLYLSDVEWFVAIKEHQDSIVENNEIKVKLFKNTWRYWCADPFVFDYEGHTYVFMEVYDKLKQQGYIGYREYKNGKISKIHVCIKTKFHLSYPFIFAYENQIYIIPECYQSSKVIAYKAVSFPNQWEEDTILLDDIKACDTNILELENNRYMLTMELYGQPFQYDRLCLYYQKDGEWIRTKNNPVVLGNKCARNAGAIFYDKGRMIRPAQNCSDSYGENIYFKEITEITEDTYCEKEKGSLIATSISVTNSKKKFDGIHTFNTNYRYDVIDLRIAKTIQPAKLVGLVIKKVSSLMRK